MENDFVVVLPGLVAGIECKSTLGAKQLSKACKQWARLKLVLEEELGLGKEFKFVKCLAYRKAGKGFRENVDCPQCQTYLLQWTAEKEFQSKLQELLKDAPKTPETEEQKDQFKNAVRDLLVFTSRRSGLVDIETRVSDAYAQRHILHLNTPAEAVFFWDPKQYDIIRVDKKLVLLQGRECTSNEH